MMRDIQTLLDYEIKKKPAIVALFARLPAMDETEIAQLKIPKWIREAFLKLKQQQRYQETMTSTLATIKFVDDVVPDPMGDMRQWTDQDTYVRLDRGGAIELRYGKHVWLPETGGIWYETIFSNFIDPRIFQYSRHISKLQRTVYTETYRNIINGNQSYQNCPVIASNHDGVAPDSPLGRLASLGVRVSR